MRTEIKFERTGRLFGREYPVAKVDGVEHIVHYVPGYAVVIDEDSGCASAEPFSNLLHDPDTGAIAGAHREIRVHIDDLVSDSWDEVWTTNLISVAPTLAKAQLVADMLNSACGAYRQLKDLNSAS